MAEERNIELRSEKVRNIVGKIPPAVDRYGIIAIGLMLMVVMVVSMLIPYKETIHLSVKFDPSQSKTEGIAYVDARQARQIHEGMRVSIIVMDESITGEVVSVSENRINGKHAVKIMTTGDDEIIADVDLDVEAVMMDRSWFKVLMGIEY